MGLVRLVVLGLLVAAMVCFGLYAVTGSQVWRQRGLSILKWIVLVLAAFFAILIAERVARAL
jgi:hypothetical protein